MTRESVAELPAWLAAGRGGQPDALQPEADPTSAHRRTDSPTRGLGAHPVRRRRRGPRGAADRARARHALARRARSRFPGGAQDADDADEVAAALREAEEETGLDPPASTCSASCPTLWLPPSNFAVTPVLGWWRTPSAGARRRPGRDRVGPPVPVAELARPGQPGDRPTTRRAIVGRGSWSAASSSGGSPPRCSSRLFDLARAGSQALGHDAGVDRPARP